MSPGEQKQKPENNEICKMCKGTPLHCKAYSSDQNQKTWNQDNLTRDSSLPMAVNSDESYLPTAPFSIDMTSHYHNTKMLKLKFGFSEAESFGEFKSDAILFLKILGIPGKWPTEFVIRRIKTRTKERWHKQKKLYQMTWYQLILQIISTNNLSFAEGSGKVRKTLFAAKGFGVGINQMGDIQELINSVVE